MESEEREERERGRRERERKPDSGGRMETESVTAMNGKRGKTK